MRTRKKTREVSAGGLVIGGTGPVSIQSMTSVPLEDVDGTVKQIKRLTEAGADLVRVAVRTMDSIKYLKKVIPQVDVPLSADVHFNYKIAVAAIEAGIHKVRINPGNIGSDAKVREVIKAAKDHTVPVRVGVNGGSIDRKKYSDVTPENLVASAMEHIAILEDNNFFDTVVSIKTSDIRQTIDANIVFSETRDYPLHVGLTEAGYGLSCIVQSSVAIGHLLMMGIGDTIRVSMTGDPVEEIVTGKKILESAGERTPCIRIISCPTCGRTDQSLDILTLAKEVDETVHSKFFNVLNASGGAITVAVMGCEVNGPGEASHADAGLAGAGPGHLLLFAGGKKIKRVRAEEAVQSLVDEIFKIIS